MLGFTLLHPDQSRVRQRFGRKSRRADEAVWRHPRAHHYGGQSAVRSGVLDRVKKSLDEAGIFHVELGGVVPNPHLAKVREGALSCPRPTA